ncbi:hypothetical protein B0H14DRAFT_3695198 [Mycena olivaceomarginata]|nr:hypothetical protein B0H14DRAFT_3695198 [Mycena olivaceomarginata]
MAKADRKSPNRQLTPAELKAQVEMALGKLTAPGLCDSKVHSVRKLANGNIRVQANTEEQAKLFLLHGQEWTTLFEPDAYVHRETFKLVANYAPTTFIRRRTNYDNQGKIPVPSAIRDVYWLHDQKDASVKKAASSLVIVLGDAAAADTLIVRSLSLAGTSCPVSYYTPPPLQCYHCQEDGHMAKACSARKDPATIKCTRCAGPHVTHDCASARIHPVSLPRSSFASRAGPGARAQINDAIPEWLRVRDLNCRKQPEVLMSLLNDTSPSKFDVLTDLVFTTPRLADTVTKTEPPPRYWWRDADWDTFSKVVKDNISTTEDLDALASDLLNGYVAAMESAVPLAEKSAFSKHSFTADLKKMLCELNKLKNRAAKKNSSQAEHNTVKPARNAYHSALRVQKRRHWKEWLKDATERTVWQAHKYASQHSVNTTASRVPDLETADGTVHCNAEKYAEFKTPQATLFGYP